MLGEKKSWGYFNVFARTISLSDFWPYLTGRGKAHLGVSIGLNLIDTACKLLAPLSLARAVEAIAAAEEEMVFGHYAVTPQTLLFLFTLFHMIHASIPYAQKMLQLEPSHNVMVHYANNVLEASQVFSLSENNIGKFHESLGHHLSSINFKIPRMLPAITDGVHAVLFDFLAGTPVIFLRFGTPIGLISIIYLILVGGVLNELMSRCTELTVRETKVMEKIGGFFSAVHMKVDSSETIRGFNRTTFEQEQLKNDFIENLKYNRDTSYRETYWVTQPVVASGILLGAIFYLGRNGYHRSDLDDFIFLQSYILTLGQNVNSLGHSYRSAAECIAAIDSIKSFLNTTPYEKGLPAPLLGAAPSLEEHDKKKLPAPIVSVPLGAYDENSLSDPLFKDTAPSEEEEEHGNAGQISRNMHLEQSAPPYAVEFDGVSLVMSGKKILENITFRIHQGTKVGLVGQTGLGKTSLLSLLCRFAEPTHGVIRILGQDIQKLSSEELRNRVGLVSQQVYVFPQESLRYNIAYAYMDVSELKRLARKQEEDRSEGCECTTHKGKAPSTTALPTDPLTSDAIDKVELSELAALNLKHSQGVSGGEKQRVGIARLLARKSSIFLLDEPTSQLDAETEYSVLKSINRAREASNKSNDGKKITLFVSAHRLSTIADSDHILVLGKAEKQGPSTIMEQGTHRSLLEKQGIYARNWKLLTEVGPEAESPQRSTAPSLPPLLPPTQLPPSLSP